MKQRGEVMRIMRSNKVYALVGALITAGVIAAVSVGAVWSQGVLADGTSLHFRVVHTIANDFDSGWHTHPGPVLVQVQQGSLQITQGSCTAKTVSAGETYIEIPYVPVRGVATGRVEWTTTMLGRIEEALTTPLPTSPCP
jgi:hypothetical protein